MGRDELWLAAMVAIAAILVLRWSWSRRSRRTVPNIVGWGLLALALVRGADAGGAWGIAITSLIAMGAATILLAWAAARSPRGAARASDRRVRMLPEAGEPLGLGGRALTFALVVIGGAAASVALAIGLRTVTLLAGWSEADASAAAFIAVPLAWGVLATILLMQERRLVQAATLALASLPLLPALLIGS